MQNTCNSAAVTEAAEASPMDSALPRSAAGEVANLTRIDPGLTSPTGYYRWMNVADQLYAAAYPDTYSYTAANVQVEFETPAPTLRGTLTAANLKPNFAYQLKLVAGPELSCNERIAKAGRYWEQTWSGTEWGSGWNLNSKGDGTYPNPNDLTYLARRDAPSQTSPTGKLYSYTGYLDGFLHHRRLRRRHAPFRGQLQLSRPLVGSGHLFRRQSGVVRSLAAPAGIRHQPSPGHRQRVGRVGATAAGGVFLDPGSYTCQMVLTEESFHSYSTYGGRWAAAMGGEISFSILLPGDANRDCRIDILDLIYIRNRLNRDTRSDGTGQADVNGDGRVNILDLIYVRNILNTRCAP